MYIQNVFRTTSGESGPPARRALLAFLAAVFALAWLPGQAAAQTPHVGYLYKIEGYLYGQRVVYVGSAKSLKSRLTDTNHDWSKLLGQKTTKVSYKKVFAKLNIKASNQGTPFSARNEALRSVEQPELDKARKQVDRENRKRAPGSKRAKVGNAIEASKTPDVWRKRHKASASRRWRVLREPAITGSRVMLRAVGGVLLLVEAYRLYYDYKVSRFVMAPYLLEDENGVFTLDYAKSSWFADMKYYKNYVAGDKQGQKIQVSESVFKDLADEAKALWGTLDRAGDFVPGLLMPSLDVIADNA